MIRLLENKFEQFRYYTNFKIDKESIQSLNPEFSLCTVLVAYHGDNRNKSSISKQVFDDNLWTIYGIPIIGEWIKIEEDQNKETWGSHGGRLILDSEGIKYEQTTRPFGFVTEEAYKNASWVDVIEKDGHTIHEYIKLEKCILWNSRYKEVDSILIENFGQSMEISNVDGFYRDDGYFEITKFSYSALCILGNQVEPCFESSMIGRQYEINQFKNEVQQMMEEYKNYNVQFKINEQKEECDNMNDIVIKALSEYVFNNEINKTEFKYGLLGMDEFSVHVVDCSDGYKIYAIKYTIKDNNVIFDFENKSEKALSIGDKLEGEDGVIFSIFDEVNKVSSIRIDYKVKENTALLTQDFEAKYNDFESKIEQLNHELDVATAKLAEFEAEKAKVDAEKHERAINDVVAEYEKKLCNNAEFMMYKAKLNPLETNAEQVKVDLTLMLGNMAMNKKSNTYSYSPTVYGNATNTSKSNPIHSRYGDLFAFLDK